MNKRTAVKFALLSPVLLLFSAIGVAQDTASLTGTVRDGTGAVIPGAQVTLKNTANGMTPDGVSGNGSYADVIGNPHATPCSVPYPGTPGPQLYNSCAYEQPEGLTFGDSGRNSRVQLIAPISTCRPTRSSSPRRKSTCNFGPRRSISLATRNGAV